MAKNSIPFTENDRLILKSYKTLMEGLADYLGSGYEFVLHSLEDLNESVIQIINGHHTGRKVGAPVTDLALSMLTELEKKENSGHISYNTTNIKGEPLKAVTIVIKGEDDKNIGLLCINFYLNTPLSDIILNLNNSWEHNAGNTYAKESFVDNVDELIFQAVSQVQKEVEMDESVSHLLKNKIIVSKLYHQGVFQFKDAVVKIAEILGISKNTVYMHLRAMNSSE
ncbi:helix-turn-helix transcriptional regulator [Oceanobacillus timonensis]|uniref:helix-turn-helix transcriptional regulator n=1 Tax=Oceanobacillus timonensis TaxID=1926285 RepID=UPI0009BB229C|nr:PAS domain-containing protein [Oceanobacillus timonensis]